MVDYHEITSSREYLTQDRMTSYYYQLFGILDLVERSGEEHLRILEVGGSNNVLKANLLNYFDTHHMEHEVVSCDVEEWAEPDLVADVRDLPLPDDYADISACFQVLEHLPYDEVGRALAELRRVTRRRIVISVPHVTLHLVLGLKLPSRPMRTFFVPFGDPFFVRFDGPKEPAFHCWELGYRGYSRRGFERLLRSTGLTVTGRFRNPYLPWHHFFILEV